MLLEFNNIAPDVSFAIKREVAILGYTPVEATDEPLLRSFIGIATPTTDVSEQPSGVQGLMKISFHFFESLISMEHGESTVVLPIDLLTPQNLSLLLASTLGDARPTDPPATMFLGRDGQLALVQGLGVPFMSDEVLLFSGHWMANDRKPDEMLLHSSGGKNFYLTKVVQSDRGRVLLDKTRIVCVWEDVVIYADGYISDVSLYWRMKLTAAPPLDFISFGGILYALDVAGNVYAINLKNRRLLFSDHFEGATMIELMDGRLHVSSKKDLIVYSPDFSTKEVHPISSNRTGEYALKSYATFKSRVAPSVAGLALTRFGVFKGRTFLGDQLYLVRVKDGNVHVFTNIGVWTFPLTVR